MNNRIILFLDLDGVLITTPPWKADEIDNDGYSKFSPILVNNLNTLLSKGDFDIWLSSSRRKNMTLDNLNSIFKNRKIKEKITGVLPVAEKKQSRIDEIQEFIKLHDIKKFLILDDDKSLNSLNLELKKNLIITSYLKGFDFEKLNEALIKLNFLNSDLYLKFKILLQKRKKLHLNDDNGIKEIWNQLTLLLSKDIEETILLFNKASEEEVSWASEIFEDIALVVKNQKYIHCLEMLNKKFPDSQIAHSIEIAKNHHNS